MQPSSGRVHDSRQSPVAHLVVQVVAAARQSSMHCCLSRLASVASEVTAANSGRAAINMARARGLDFIDFLRFAPRITPRGNMWNVGARDGSALSGTPNGGMIERRYSRDVGSLAMKAFANARG
jgi:hypothetical protein